MNKNKGSKFVLDSRAGIRKYYLKDTSIYSKRDVGCVSFTRETVHQRFVQMVSKNA